MKVNQSQPRFIKKKSETISPEKLSKSNSDLQVIPDFPQKPSLVLVEPSPRDRRQQLIYNLKREILDEGINLDETVKAI